MPIWYVFFNTTHQMAKQINKKINKEDLLESEIQEIINDTSETGSSLFNQHWILIEKGQRNLLVCKQNDAKKISNKTHVWVVIDSKTTVLRKVKNDGETNK